MTNSETHYASKGFLALARKLSESRSLVLATGAIALLALLSGLFLDKALAIYISENLSEEAYLVWRDITKIGEAAIYIWAFVFLFIAGRAAMIWSTPLPISEWYENVARLGLFGIMGFLLSGAFIHSFKFIFGRIRPKTFISENLYGFEFFSTNWSYNSFPSGHSQTIFVMAGIFSYFFPRQAWAFLLFAAIIAVSRMLVQAHYLSDILVGSFIGLISVIIVKERWFGDINKVNFRPSNYMKNMPEGRS